MFEPLQKLPINSITHLILIPTPCLISSFLHLSILVTPHILRKHLVSIASSLCFSTITVSTTALSHKSPFHIQVWTPIWDIIFNATHVVIPLHTLIFACSCNPPSLLKELPIYMEELTISMNFQFISSSVWDAIPPLLTTVTLVFSTFSIFFLLDVVPISFTNLCSYSSDSAACAVSSAKCSWPRNHSLWSRSIILTPFPWVVSFK